MSAHIPGPWRVKVLTTGPTFIEVLADTGPPIVAWTGFDNQAVPVQRHEANARLMAAAPELLEALKALVDLSNAMVRARLAGTPLQDFQPRFNTARAIAEAAIAKAEGR